jgi:hypothetical protein
MSPIVVHQALHGYSDGHRLISSSLPLKGSEARIMLVMSDLSGPGVRPTSSGYLTGYPLEMIGKYVLARTWAAPEMPRPGCVWTHSLIIDNADLARIVSAETLLRAFKRPDGLAPNSIYGGTATILPQAAPQAVSSSMRVSKILNALYRFPDRAIVAEVDESVEDERLVTAIWMQQWPRLRRAFGFCTLSGMERSGKGVGLDLQLARLSDRQLQSKFPDAIVPDHAAIDSALAPLMDDLVMPGTSQLREFLRRTGGDVDGGRRAMVPLCKLYTCVFDTQPLDLRGAVKALTSLDSEGRRQARSVRSVVARHALKDADHVDDTVFDFLLDTLEHATDPAERLELGDQLGAVLWHRSPDRFQDAMVEGGLLGDVASHSLKKMPQWEIIDGLRKSSVLVPEIVERRPDILLNGELWRIPEVNDSLAEKVSSEDAGLAACALLAAGRTGPAGLIIERADADAIAIALESPEADRDAVLEWLFALSKRPNKAAAVLASGRIARLSMLVDFARRSDPDSIPNDYGDDPWLIALRSGSGPLNRIDEDFLAAFLLARALGSRSRSQAELLRFAYTKVYRALETRRLPSQVEGLVTSRLRWGSWFDWDNCSRLRETVTRRFIDNHLDPEAFGRLSDDGPLAIALIDEAARSGRGRRYLEEVRKRLKKASEHRIKFRADHIAKKLK